MGARGAPVAMRLLLLLETAGSTSNICFIASQAPDERPCDLANSLVVLCRVVRGVAEVGKALLQMVEKPGMLALHIGDGLEEEMLDDDLSPPLANDSVREVRQVAAGCPVSIHPHALRWRGSARMALLLARSAGEGACGS